MTLPVFVINLERSSLRRESIIRHLTDRGISFSLCSAVDGSTLSLAETVSQYGLQNFSCRFFNTRSLTLSEIGCLLSHINIWQRMLAEGIDRCCVLEDDVHVHEDFAKVLRHLDQETETWELLLLGHHYSDKSPLIGVPCLPGGQAVGRFLLATPVQSPVGTYGYVITRATAEKLLRSVFPLRMPADMFLASAGCVLSVLKVLSPPAVWPAPLSAPSTIQRSILQYRFKGIQRLKARCRETLPLPCTIFSWHHRLLILWYQRLLIFLRVRGILASPYARKQ